MKSCIYCGERLEDDDLFCTCCGQRQPVTAEMKERQGQEAAAKQSVQRDVVDVMAKVAEQNAVQAGQESQKAAVKVAKAKGKSNGERQGSAAKKTSPKTSSKMPWLKKVKRVYDKLPKVCDDKDCGCPNCYGFALKVAAGTADMAECPYC